jgi:tetratricopeptide (TPR) repeat protein
MDCERINRFASRDLPRIATQVFVWVAIIIAMLHTAMAMAQAPRPEARQVLAKAMEYQLGFRAGNLAVIPEYVAMLEAATQAEAGNADLWYALGRAYLMRGARAMLPGGDEADAPRAIPPAMAALQRALRIDPDHAEALAQQAAVQGLIASQMNMPARAAGSVAQMNRAVELAPHSTMVRLVRGFLGPNLPETLRNRAAEAEDLDFLIEAASYSRAGDYMRIMRGDLDFESGKPELARQHYQIVAESGSRAAVEARARLTALQKGGVPMEDIRALRTSAGAQCTMCHGP